MSYLTFRNVNSLLLLPAILPILFWPENLLTAIPTAFSENSRGEINQPPVAVDDSFTVHGSTQLPSVLANDSDPDGDSIHFDSYVTLPQHGTLTGVGYPTRARVPPGDWIRWNRKLQLSHLRQSRRLRNC